MYSSGDMSASLCLGAGQGPSELRTAKKEASGIMELRQWPQQVGSL